MAITTFAAVKRFCETEQRKITTWLEDLEHRLMKPGQANQQTDTIGMDSPRQEVEALATAIAEHKANPTGDLANDVRLLQSEVNRLLVYSTVVADVSPPT